MNRNIIKVILTTKKRNDKYFICMKQYFQDKISIETCISNRIADFFNIGSAYYYEELIRNFNAHIGIGWELCFDTNNESEKAIDWINSLYIVNKLLGSSKE